MWETRTLRLESCTPLFNTEFSSHSNGPQADAQILRQWFSTPAAHKNHLQSF